MLEELKSARNIAIVGLSKKQYRTSNHIAQYLIDEGYSIIPVNPEEDEIFGLEVYQNLHDIPEDIHIDIINVFRNNRYTEALMKEIKEWVGKRGYKPLVWTQLDVSSYEAEQIAEESDIPYVKNRCIMVEHRRI